MDARKFGIALSIACLVITTALTRQAEAQGARVASRNFIVYAANSQQAQEALQTAENYRSELAMLWLGEPLPDWQVPCPIKVRMSPNLGAGGKTTLRSIAARSPIGIWKSLDRENESSIVSYHTRSRIQSWQPTSRRSANRFQDGPMKEHARRSNTRASVRSTINSWCSLCRPDEPFPSRRCSHFEIIQTISCHSMRKAIRWLAS